MTKPLEERRIPHISVLLSASSTEQDAVERAGELLRNRHRVGDFKIVHVKLAFEDERSKRYLVAFVMPYPTGIIYTDKAFDRIMDEWSMWILDPAGLLPN